MTMYTTNLTQEEITTYENKILNKEKKLIAFPKKKYLQDTTFHWLIGFFSHGRIYKEKEINEVLNDNCMFSNAALLRRELFNHYYFSRTYDGSIYWRSDFSYYPFTLLEYRFLDFSEDLTDSILTLHETLSFYHEISHTTFTKEDVALLIAHKNLPPDGSTYFFGGKAICDATHNVIGYFTYYEGYPDEDTLWISSFFFHASYQKKGLGSMLFEEIKQAARFCGYEKIGLGVYKENIPALSFWKKQGLIETFVSKLDENGVCVLRLELNL